MNRQEVFDAVATHLSKQGRRASSGTRFITADEADKVSCWYRTATGLSCAVGCLIPDEEYDPGMEGALGCLTTQTWKVRAPRTHALVSEHHHLLSSLQRIHDDSGPNYPYDTIMNRLADLAHDEGLDPTVLCTLHFPEVWR